MSQCGGGTGNGGDGVDVELGRCNADTPCSDGRCCSQYNWCGDTADHCTTGCQSNCSDGDNGGDNGDGNTGSGNHADTALQDSLGGYRRCVNPGQIALTFDDGPGAYTRPIMDALEAYGVVGTFFILGSSVDADPGHAAEIVARGHEVANHSQTHPDLTQISTSQVISEIQQCESAIQSATGLIPALFRPPFGAYNAAVTSVTNSLGLSTIIWNLDTFDWRDRDPEDIRAKFAPILSADASGSSFITLQHDINEGSGAAMADIMSDLITTDFEFVTVSECIGVEPYQ